MLVFHVWSIQRGTEVRLVNVGNDPTMNVKLYIRLAGFFWSFWTRKMFIIREFSHLAVDLLQMSKVPWYKQRLKALLFKARFADKVEEIKPVGINEILCKPLNLLLFPIVVPFKVLPSVIKTMPARCWRGSWVEWRLVPRSGCPAHLTSLGCRLTKLCNRCNISEHYGFFSAESKKEFHLTCLLLPFLFSTLCTAFDMTLFQQSNNMSKVGA